MKFDLPRLENMDERTVRIAAAAAGAAAVGGLALYVSNRHRRLAVPKTGRHPPESLPDGAFDAVIVGGGPSGSTCAYYMAKGGSKVHRGLIGVHLARSPADRGLHVLPACNTNSCHMLE
jgi:hypothetical protein